MIYEQDIARIRGIEGPRFSRSRPCGARAVLRDLARWLGRFWGNLRGWGHVR